MAERRAAALVLLAVAIAYVNALWGAFQFDDFNVIVGNPAVHSWIGFLASMPGLRPLLKASYTFSWTSGGSPAAFHLFNIAVHAGNALIVLALARRWSHAIAPSLSGARRTWTALGAALLFALHPAQTEAVTYVSGRSASLMALGYLAALLTWHRTFERNPDVVPWASLAWFGCALAVKETAWTLPLAIVLVAYAACRTGWAGALRAARFHAALVFVFAILVVILEPYRRLLFASLPGQHPFAHLVDQSIGVTYLILHPLLTLRLSIDPQIGAPAGWMASTGALALGVTLIAFGIVGVRRRTIAGFGLGWFLLHLAPSHSLFARFDLANDRQLYLALIGPAFAIAIACATRIRRRFALAAAMLVPILLGVTTVLRNRDYRDEIALWEATVRVAPAKPRAWNNMGYAYELAGDVERARLAYQRALDLDPGFHKARINLDRVGRILR